MTNNETEVQTLCQHLDRSHKKPHPNILQLLKYHTVPDENFCASTFVIYTAWQYLENNLHSEIQLRSCQEQPFPDHYLLKLVKEIITGLAY